MEQIGKKKALELIKGSKGRFFSVTFKKKEGEIRTLNVRYLKQQPNELGYVLLLDMKDKTPKNVNLQTLSQLKINNQILKIK